MHAAFLAAVIAAPESDAPRLVYADWLDELGDAAASDRAAFIRAQCALAAVDGRDPRAIDLTVLAYRLLTQYGDDWLAPVRDLLEPPGLGHTIGSLLGWSASRALLNHEFRRGFLHTLHLDVLAYLTHHAELHALAPIGDLRVQVGRDATAVGAVASLADCPSLVHVRELHLGALRLFHGELPRLLNSPHLANLRALNVHCPDLDAVSVEDLVDSALLERLTALKLWGAGRVGPLGLALLADCHRAAGLRSLALNIVGLTAEAIPAVFASPHFAGLTALDLSHNHLGNAGLPGLIAHVPPHLDRLDLSDTDLGDAGAEALAAAPLLRRLRRLKLDHNRITDRGALALADSPHLVGDTRVSLVGNAGITPRVWDVLRYRLGDRLAAEERG